MQEQLRSAAKVGRTEEVGALLGRWDSAQFINAGDDEVRCCRDLTKFIQTCCSLLVFLPW